MTNLKHGLTRLDIFLNECLKGYALNDASVLPQVFGYLLGESNPVTGNLNDADVLSAFDNLVETMRTDVVADGPAEAGMTFFGQFVDHDVTLDATSSIGTAIDPRSIRNIRTPNLDLDCIYGDGPEASPHLYSKDHEGYLLFGRTDNPLDLARNCKGTALIGDPRNDENIIVSQIQGAFICLHNIALFKAENDENFRSIIHQFSQEGMRGDIWSDGIMPAGLELFEEVRRFVRLHYQYVVVNDLLPSFVDKSELSAALANDPFESFGPGPILPAEFSVAAYRFGHATVQPTYVLRDGEGPIDLFAMQGFGPRDPAGNIEFSKFFDISGTAPRALPVGTKMADTLFDLKFISGTLKYRSTETTELQAKKLALRNILRDRGTLLIKSGQQVARSLGIEELSAPNELSSAGITKTPLWFYCLQEAEGVGRLKGVGASILGSVFGRILRYDSESVIHLHDFTPWNGFGGTDCSVSHLMEFVESNRDVISFADELHCG